MDIEARPEAIDDNAVGMGGGAGIDCCIEDVGIDRDAGIFPYLGNRFMSKSSNCC